MLKFAARLHVIKIYIKSLTLAFFKRKSKPFVKILLRRLIGLHWLSRTDE